MKLYLKLNINKFKHIKFKYQLMHMFIKLVILMALLVMGNTVQQ